MRRLRGYRRAYDRSMEEAAKLDVRATLLAERARVIEELQTEMLKAAKDLEFERAGILRDRIGQLKNAMGEPLDSVESKPSSGGKKGKRRGRKASKRRGSKVPRPRKQD